jgi:drug/metabolite transporter (DMT)-like permease
VALVAFASNSILCRLALGSVLIDATVFTVLRLASGAAVLTLLIAFRHRRFPDVRRRWPTALSLLLYAAPFSFAYTLIPAGVGALVLFASVQATMIGYGMVYGHRMHRGELLGLAVAMSGLIGLTIPGATAPDLPGVLLMIVAGIAWGIYSLMGRTARDPVDSTAGNFVMCAVISVPLLVLQPSEAAVSGTGLAFAMLSGGVTSGLGYVAWYAALRGLTPARAGIVQLVVPVLTAVAGVLMLGEEVSWRLAFSGTVILGGVAIAMRSPRDDQSAFTETPT